CRGVVGLEDGAGSCNQRIGFQVTVGIEREHGDALSGLDPEELQAARQLRGATRELSPAETARTADAGARPGELLERPLDTLRDAHRMPFLLSTRFASAGNPMRAC